MRLTLVLQALLYGVTAWAEVRDTTSHVPLTGETVIRELRPLLSREATIVLPASKKGAELQIRASTPRIKPGYVAIVEVASEKDVQETVSLQGC